MKVILTADIKSLGKKGQVVEVSDGYARNCLIPKKQAIEATASAMNEQKNREAAERARIEKEKATAREAAAKIGTLTVKLTSKAGADGKLYGAVTAKDIAEALEKQHGVTIDKRKLSLGEPIKAFGTYRVDVKLYTEISAKLTVVVTDN